MQFILASHFLYSVNLIKVSSGHSNYSSCQQGTKKRHKKTHQSQISTALKTYSS